MKNKMFQNIKKNRRWGPLEHLKISKKSLTAPKQIEKGEPLVSSGFVRYV